jgi:hypothetical protein
VIVLRDHIEVVERPIENIQNGPAEFAIGAIVIGAMAQQKVTRLDEALMGTHSVTS